MTAVSEAVLKQQGGEENDNEIPERMTREARESMRRQDDERVREDYRGYRDWWYTAYVGLEGGHQRVYPANVTAKLVLGGVKERTSHNERVESEYPT